ncbi:Uncharacterised protein [Legionella pneumophila]|nr:Uncharacterised protein [Legionella pneumophila]CZJ19456.1 Uncharacterised protein [Legionella pneumophila]CZL16668.1 Uncharacterised protein [Legionella pneumophila]
MYLKEPRDIFIIKQISVRDRFSFYLLQVQTNLRDKVYLITSIKLEVTNSYCKNYQ